MKAIWNDQIIAQSDDLVKVEGNYYFPRSSVNEEFLEDSNKVTRCFWKGEANYYHLNVNGQKNEDAVWYYANPKSAAKDVTDRVAFWKGVEIID